jgi:hypothetical protein
MRVSSQTFHRIWRATLVLAFLSCVAIIGWWYLKDADRSGSRMPNQATSELTTSGPKMATAASVGSNGTVERALEQSRTHARELSRASSYRDFALKALDSPGTGGVYYADLAFMHCLRVHGVGSPPAGWTPRSPAASEALSRLQKELVRCDGFDARSAAASTVQKSFAATLRAANDPLIQAVGGRGFMEMKDDIAAHDLLRTAVATRDASVISNVLSMVAPFALAKAFEGEKVKPDRATVDAAHGIVSCRLSGNCDSHFDAVVYCLGATEPCTSLNIETVWRSRVNEASTPMLERSIRILTGFTRQ